MKAVRICFLLLLAVLLPIRGAVAATMMCSSGAPVQQTELHQGHHTVDHASMHGAVGHDAAIDHHDGAQGGTSDKCNLCSASCSPTPLAGTGPLLAEPLGLTAVEQSDHAAPPPSFLSDGQERPPRTL